MGGLSSTFGPVAGSGGLVDPSLDSHQTKVNIEPKLIVFVSILVVFVVWILFKVN